MVEIISTNELKSMIENDSNFVLIDVRREDELSNGMIPNAKHLVLDEFPIAFKMNGDEFLDRYGFKKPDMGDLVIVHCRSGGRSERAASFLISNGYSNVKNYAGSIKEWSEIDSNVKMY